jgi:hypothetical protein
MQNKRVNIAVAGLGRMASLPTDYYISMAILMQYRANAMSTP